jgi:hypothetical protein
VSGSVPTLMPDAETSRVDLRVEDLDPASSDGIPVMSDDTADDMLLPEVAAVQTVDAPEPTRRLPILSLRQKFDVLKRLQIFAERAQIHLEVELMPSHAPTGVHVLSSHWRRLSNWLRHQSVDRFRKVQIDLVLPPDLYESGLWMRTSVATTVPLLAHRVISSGHVDYVYVPFRED